MHITLESVDVALVTFVRLTFTEGSPRRYTGTLVSLLTLVAFPSGAKPRLPRPNMLVVLVTLVALMSVDTKNSLAKDKLLMFPTSEAFSASLD